MPLLNNYLANSPNFLGGITPGQSTGTVEPQGASKEKNEAFGGGGFGSPQGGGGMGGLFGRPNSMLGEMGGPLDGHALWQAEHPQQETIQPQAQPQPQPMMPPPAPSTGVAPMFSQPQYSPPMASSPAVQQATPFIQQFMNPQTSPNYSANAMPIFNR